MNSSDFESLQELKQEWDSFQPLPTDADERLWRKLRLEWDFHSNHIEGNTLTYGETELLVVFGETRGNHTIREYEEMKAHDVAIRHVRALADESRDLAEIDIRQLNELLLKEPFWKDARTSTGVPTRTQIVPGQYKAHPNNVETLTGEVVRFAEPSEVPFRMHDFLKILNTQPPLNEAFIAHLARMHHEFLLIHPFDDGNGRVARLLLNYSLLKRGYPPIIIRTEQKGAYFSALHRADTEHRDYSELSSLFEKALRWSLELGIKAAKGEAVEEPFDIEKEIAIYAADNAEKAPVMATNEIIVKLWDNSLHSLFQKIEEKSIVFKKLFSIVELSAGGIGMNANWDAMVQQWLRNFVQGGTIPLSLYCEHYNVRGVPPFNQNFPLNVTFNKYDYQVSLTPLPQRLMPYSDHLTPSEVDEMVAAFLKSAFEVIRKKAEKK